MEPKQISCHHKLPSLSATYPWFIAQNLESGNQIIYTIGNKQNHYQCRIRELHGRRIRACFHGWVILSNHPDSVLWSLWNPLTSKLICLPPLAHAEKGSYECCLSSPPDHQGSVFLLTTAKVHTIVFCRLDCKRERLTWIEISYAKQLRGISHAHLSDLEYPDLDPDVDVVADCFLECPTCCNGKVYALALGPFYSFVIEVDIAVKGKEVVISLLPYVKIPDMSYNRCPATSSFHRFHVFLKGYGTELFYIVVCSIDGMRIRDVYLFKLDFTSMMWEKMVDLKDAIFFVELASDYSACYYGSSFDSKLGGYVHILGDSGKIIYSFHARDETMSISSMPCIVQESQASAWAMLEWRLEVDHVECKQEEEEKDTNLRLVKDYNTEFDTRTGETHLLDIPIDVLQMIMELCIGREYMRFRATCKLCYLTTPSIQWSNKTTLRRLQIVSPWLMVLDNDRGIITFTDPARGDRYYLKKPQELKGDYQIYCSKYGWLLMYQICGPIVFYNPFTSNTIELPVVPYLQSFCFSAPPTSPDCMVVGFTTYGESHVYFHFVSRDSTWYKFRLNFGGDDPYTYYYPTFIGRDCYALCNNKGLDVFIDMTEDNYSWEVVVDEAAVSGCKSPAQYFLAICDQHFFLVIVDEYGESVEVFKIDDSTEEWEKTNGLGKHMIYISDTSCICLEAKSPEMENKIYFPRLCNNGGTKIVFYSLDTCRFHTFDDKNSAEGFSADLFGTKHNCSPHTWIEPSWS